MAALYEQFNEILFESYCKRCIDNAVRKERMKKLARAQWERSFSSMTDAELYGLEREDLALDEVEREDIRFIVRGKEVHLHNSGLGNALYFLIPRDREIILLYYFMDMNDDEIARELTIPRATVQRRRNAAKEKLRVLLGENNETDSFSDYSRGEKF